MSDLKKDAGKFFGPIFAALIVIALAIGWFIWGLLTQGNVPDTGDLETEPAIEGVNPSSSTGPTTPPPTIPAPFAPPDQQ